MEARNSEVIYNIPRTPCDVYSIDEDSIRVPLLSRVLKDGASRSLKEKLKHIKFIRRWLASWNRERTAITNAQTNQEITE